MSSALIVRRDGPGATPATGAFEAVVGALGHTVERRVRTERAEHNRYGVGPETVEELAALVAETGADCVAVDDDLHPGQLADLAGALSGATVRDRRGAVTAALAAAGNPVAENRAEEWTLQVERRRLANERRAGESDPADDRIADTDRRRQRLDDEYESLRETARTRLKTGHETAGARVVLTRTVGADGGAWSALAGDAVDADPTTGDGNPLAPGTPTTESVPVAAGTVALTAVPALPVDLPEWYREAVPGATAALRRADAVVLAVESASSVADSVDRLRAVTDAPLVVWTPAGASDVDAGPPGSADTSESGDGPTTVTVVGGSAAALRERVTDLLPTTRLSVRLPYDDDAHALVSWLHGHAHVADVDYGDAIAATVVAFAETAATVRRRVDAVGGTVTEG